MIFELTKNLTHLGADFVLRDENAISFCHLDLIKGGVILTNDTGELIAQLLQDKNGVTASIADGASLVVDKDYNITPIKIDLADSQITDTSQSRTEETDFFYFGRPQNFAYELYAQQKDNTKPALWAEVIAHPWKEANFKVRINEYINKLKALSLVLAFALVAQS